MELWGKHVFFHVCFSQCLSVSVFFSSVASCFRFVLLPLFYVSVCSSISRFCVFFFCFFNVVFVFLYFLFCVFSIRFSVAVDAAPLAARSGAVRPVGEPAAEGRRPPPPRGAALGRGRAA